MAGFADPDLDGYITIPWDSLDHWFEEDEEVFVHPRDPFVRVDALKSSRHVRVERDGQLLAESDSPILVFETGLPTRYYLPERDVDPSLLADSDLRTGCAPTRDSRPDPTHYRSPPDRPGEPTGKAPPWAPAIAGPTAVSCPAPRRPCLRVCRAVLPGYLGGNWEPGRLGGPGVVGAVAV
jgi:Domain of unknown function (DUF427)